MKNKLKLIIILLLGLFIIPFNVKADTYNTLNFRETLADEEIEEEFKNYKETDDKITIYLFRGKGCGYCRAYLTFMNSITKEYGKYFKMVTYEVWNDQNNANLMNEVSTFLGQPAGGVPYIIIGDKVFAGYASDYDEDIKSAIVDLYNTKAKNRYDVFKEMKKSKKTASAGTVVVWNLLFVLVATIVVMSYMNNKFKELNTKIENLSKIESQKETRIDKSKETKKSKK